MPMTTLTQPNLPAATSGVPRWKKFKGTEKPPWCFCALVKNAVRN